MLKCTANIYKLPTIGKKTPEKLVESGQREEGAIGVWLFHQYRDFLSPGEQQPPKIPKHKHQIVPKIVGMTHVQPVRKNICVKNVQSTFSNLGLLQ